MKGKGIKFRDWEAVNAHFRNSAGAMKVKRQQEERQACRDFRKNWRHDAEEDLVEYPGEDAPYDGAYDDDDGSEEPPTSTS